MSDHKGLPAAFEALTPKQAVDTLWDVLMKDFHIGFDLFCLKIFRTDAHLDGLEVFMNYFEIHEDNLSNHIELLSDLACVFASEPECTSQYNRVKRLIEKLIERNQHVYPTQEEQLRPPPQFHEDDFPQLPQPPVKAPARVVPEPLFTVDINGSPVPPARPKPTRPKAAKK